MKRGHDRLVAVLAAATVTVAAAVVAHLIAQRSVRATPPPHAAYAYQCCAGSDIKAPVHPGGHLSLHWIATPTMAPEASPAPVELDADLVGGFPDPMAVKRSVSAGQPTGATSAAATPIHTDDWTGGAPVSTIAIPADAAPGYYSLRLSVRSGPGGLASWSVVHVTAH